MSTYTFAGSTYAGNGLSLFNAYNGEGEQTPFADRVLYVNNHEFGYLNADGSKTYVEGSGFVWDAVNGIFTAGTITAINHYDSSGAFVDSLEGIIAAGGMPVLADTFVGQLVQTNNFAPFYLPDFLMSGDDLLDGRFAPQEVVLNGWAGNDRLRGGIFDDQLSGDTGNDVAHGNDGNDLLLGGEGDDQLNGGTGNDRLLGDAGTDNLYGNGGRDALYGGGGDDQIFGGKGLDTAVFRGRFADAGIERTASGLTITNADGVDCLAGVERLAFDDGTYRWSDSADAWVRISQTPGQALATNGNVIIGTFGDDRNTLYFGSSNDDVILGLSGNDILGAGNGDDLVFGGEGNDEIGGDEQWYANGADRLYGGRGNDELAGGGGADRIYGGNGKDVIQGGAGADDLWGGAGADLFVAQSFSGPYGSGDRFDTDVIHDFVVGTDHLIFRGIAASELTLAADAQGNAVITYNAGSDPETVTLLGVSATSVTLGDLLI